MANTLQLAAEGYEGPVLSWPVKDRRTTSRRIQTCERLDGVHPQDISLAPRGWTPTKPTAVGLPMKCLCGSSQSKDWRDVPDRPPS